MAKLRLVHDALWPLIDSFSFTTYLFIVLQKFQLIRALSLLCIIRYFELKFLIEIGYFVELLLQMGNTVPQKYLVMVNEGANINK